MSKCVKTNGLYPDPLINNQKFVNDKTKTHIMRL